MKKRAAHANFVLQFSRPTLDFGGFLKASLFGFVWLIRKLENVV